VTDLRDLVEDLSEKVDRRLNQDDIDAEVKASALRALRGLGAPNQTLVSVLSDDAREEFIVDYLARERARFRAETAADLPEWVDTAADEPATRREPLCTCRNDCPVKKAQLPSAVRSAESIRVGCRQYKQRHRGHPQALEAANQEFEAFVGEARQTLRTVLAALSSQVTVETLREQESEADTEETATAGGDAAAADD
jgi:hypothetical protein